ncbi:YbbR family protein [Denitrovibrio acetiphilus DSM 12809]|uniref:YbbR family protein n=2 Tax=Denitrovibrio TaxID=117999 RepID=D4H7S2_DENA2|nr:YbbR family protein [Denitrovibrio acetiphilus DSM 12809]
MFKNLLLNNLPLKLMSVFIAVILWLSLVTGEFQEISLYVPVKLTNIPDGYVAVTDEHLINIHAKGPKSLVNEEKFGDVSIDFDVSGMKPGYNNAIISLKNIKMPPGIQVMDIQPAAIEIIVDSLILKQMKVAPTFIGEPASGYKVGSVNVFPESVQVKAAKSKIESQNTVETLPVNLSDKRDPITYSIGMKSYEGIQEYNPQQVEVFVVFKEDIQEKEFKDIPVRAVMLPHGLKAKILDTVTLKVSGRIDLLQEDVIKSELYPTVDMSGVKTKGKYLRKLNLNDSKMFKVLSVEPAKVRVEVVNEEVLRD